MADELVNVTIDGIQVAVTRRAPKSHRPSWRPEEAVDLPAAIAMYTINSAYQNRLDRETGSIEVGKLADLVVLERNLFEVPVGQVHAVRRSSLSRRAQLNFAPPHLDGVPGHRQFEDVAKESRTFGDVRCRQYQSGDVHEVRSVT